MRSFICLSCLIICLLWLSPVNAATCRDPAGFEAWLASFKREAAAQGISPSAISALNGVTYDPSIISKDHGQVFSTRVSNNSPVGWSIPLACTEGLA
jgi:membrane-bound lytic murein transglycosylase B